MALFHDGTAMSYWKDPPAAPSLGDTLPSDLAPLLCQMAMDAGHPELAIHLLPVDKTLSPGAAVPVSPLFAILKTQLKSKAKLPPVVPLAARQHLEQDAGHPELANHLLPVDKTLSPGAAVPLSPPFEVLETQLKSEAKPPPAVPQNTSPVAPPAARQHLEQEEAIATSAEGAKEDAFAELESEQPGQEAEVFLPPGNTAVILFPGQGSQYVGMLSTLKDHPRVLEYAETARSVLGYDLLRTCLEGPEAKLEETSVCQPAMFLAGIAGLERLREVRAEVVEQPCAVAGLSLGEYTALCAAGVFSFEDGLRLVQIRGAAMAEAACLRPQAMASVAGLDQQKLEQLCAKESVGDEVVQIANVLFPQGFACAGTKVAVDGLVAAAQKAGALQAKLLKTGGGFHTKLMQPAQERLEAALREMLPRMKPPRSDVYANVTGSRIPRGTPPSEIVPLLARQLCEPVLWEPSVRSVIRDGLTEFYEVGPMKQIKAMMKRIDKAAWNVTTNISV